MTWDKREWAWWAALTAVAAALVVVGCSKGKDSDERPSPANSTAASVAHKPAKTMQITIDSNDTFELIYIEPGFFTMGRKVGLTEKSVSLVSALMMIGKYPDDWPARKVTISKGFYIGKYKVTSAQFCAFLNAVRSAQDYVALDEYARIESRDETYVPRADCENCAVNVVPWKGAVVFCDWLSKKTGLTVRLPTEAEWEFTARGPEGRAHPWGKGDVEWTDRWPVEGQENKDKYPHPWSCAPVDAFPETATPDGVVGMLSWTGEWCSDFYGARYLKHDVIDPQGPTEEDLSDKSLNPFDTKYHVLRGLAGFTGPREFGNDVDESDASIYGFRIVVELPVDKQALRKERSDEPK